MLLRAVRSNNQYRKSPTDQVNKTRAYFDVKKLKQITNLSNPHIVELFSFLLCYFVRVVRKSNLYFIMLQDFMVEGNIR